MAPKEKKPLQASFALLELSQSEKPGLQGEKDVDRGKAAALKPLLYTAEGEDAVIRLKGRKRKCAIHAPKKKDSKNVKRKEKESRAQWRGEIF